LLDPPALLAVQGFGSPVVAFLLLGKRGMLITGDAEGESQRIMRPPIGARRGPVCIDGGGPLEGALYRSGVEGLAVDVLGH
jgi:hypothetical protein